LTEPIPTPSDLDAICIQDLRALIARGRRRLADGPDAIVSDLPGILRALAVDLRLINWPHSCARWAMQMASHLQGAADGLERAAGRPDAFWYGSRGQGGIIAALDHGMRQLDDLFAPAE